MSGDYQLVQLKNGTWSVRSVAEAETFHPVIGPAAEAEALYVRQLDLPARVAAAGAAGLVVWDIGLGAAANVLTLLRALAPVTGRVRVLSFDHTLAPLAFAGGQAERLEFVRGFEEPIARLLQDRRTGFRHGACEVVWEVHEGDFPTLIVSAEAGDWPRPDALLFDAYSPAKNPAMWTLPLFQRLRALAGNGPCTLATYSRATMVRTTLLLAGWFVGVGHATGEKDETTIAATQPELLIEPLDARWLERALRSTSAEPMTQPAYRQAPLSPASQEALRRHPQFAPVRANPA